MTTARHYYENYKRDYDTFVALTKGYLYTVIQGNWNYDHASNKFDVFAQLNSIQLYVSYFPLYDQYQLKSIIHSGKEHASGVLMFEQELKRTIKKHVNLQNFQ